MAFPPDPEEIRLRLLSILKPPVHPRVWMRRRGEEIGLLRRRRKAPAIMGSKMIWPYRIVWRESLGGRGVIKVLKEERAVGTISYIERSERVNLVRLLETIIRGEK